MKRLIASMMILSAIGNGAADEQPGNRQRGGSLAIEGIEVAWAFTDALLTVTVSAPTGGWVAVGFNSRDDIVGSELFMAARQGESQVAEQHAVTRAGVHPPVENLGRRSALVNYTIDQRSSPLPSGTTARFTIDPARVPAVPLTPGSEVVLILAYSVSPDFDHHSRVRRHAVAVL